jgi:UDP-glucose 4-epimerase
MYLSKVDAGYIGSHAFKALMKTGFVPVTFDNLNTGWIESVRFGPFRHGNLLYRADIDEVFEIYAPIAVIHFVALSEVGESVQDPGFY